MHQLNRLVAVSDRHILFFAQINLYCHVVCWQQNMTLWNYLMEGFQSPAWLVWKFQDKCKTDYWPEADRSPRWAPQPSRLSSLKRNKSGGGPHRGTMATFQLTILECNGRGSSRLNGHQHEKTCLRGFVNNKGADQPAHLHSLFSAFVDRLLERII